MISSKMKPCIATLLLLAPLVRATGEESHWTSRLSLSPRLGFNISARFEGVGAGGSSRLTPDGDAYNYDNGYVLTDISGNAGGQTWYWGYDDSATQVSGSTILLSRSSISGGISSVSQDADPSAGAELVYQLQIGAHERLRHGLETGAAYQNIHVTTSGGSTVTLTTMTDAYAFPAGATPPAATPSMPYQGTYQGPGFLIDDSPSSSSTVTTPNLTFSTENELSSALWAFRIGPYLDYAVTPTLSAGLSVGVAAGLLDANVTWSDRVQSTSDSGSGSDLGILMGFYAGAKASWHFAERWSVLGGFQYQNLGTYEQDFDGRTLQLDLKNAFYASIGISWIF